MTRNISRRSLVAGAAWAAPAVLTSTAIPAYASSVNPCQNLNDFEARQTVAAGRANNKKGYEEITVPEGATYMWFKIQGGYGGGVDHANRNVGDGGAGADIEGTIKVTPGQTVKFHVGAGGLGLYDKPSAGGEGYGNGGSSNTLLESGVEVSDLDEMQSPTYNHIVVYSGSGGGASAVLISDKGSSEEKLLAVAGGGGGGGTRAMTQAARETLNGTKLAGWKTDGGFPVLSNGGDASDFPQAGSNGTEVYSEYPSAIVTVRGGNPGSGANGGAGGSKATYSTAKDLSFSSTTESNIRTSTVAGVAGGSGAKANGADGVVAYSYSISTKETDQPDGGSPYKFNVTAYAVSGGGGGGYGGGGSGSVIGQGVRVTAPDQEQDIEGSSNKFRYSGAFASAGAGGAGGSYLAPGIEMWDSNGRKFWAHNNRTFGTNDTNGHGRIKVIWCDPSGSHKDYPDDPGVPAPVVPSH